MLIDYVRPVWRLLPLSVSTRKRIKAWLLARLPRKAHPTFSLLRRSEWNGDWGQLFAFPGANLTRVLVIDWKPPMPDRDSGSFRMAKLLECLTKENVPVHFIGDVPALEEIYEAQLEALGIRVCVGREAAVDWLRAHGGEYRTVILSRPEVMEQYLPLVRAFAPAATVVYDTVDLHWIRFQRGASLETDPRDLNERSENYKRLEISNARSADITIAISDEERRTLLAEDSALTVTVVPNIHEVEESDVSFADRRDLFFIGGFDHTPNVDAVLHLAKEIMPLIRAKLGDVRLHVVGSNPPPAILQIQSDAVQIVGFVRDVRPWFERSRVFVAPLRQGAGMKGKIGHSLGYGLPVVTSRIGAEGIGLIDGQNAYISDNPSEFASKVVSLYTNPDLWKQFSSSGKELIKRKFSMSALCVQFREGIGLMNRVAVRESH